MIGIGNVRGLSGDLRAALAAHRFAHCAALYHGGGAGWPGGIPIGNEALVVSSLQHYRLTRPRRPPQQHSFCPAISARRRALSWTRG